MDLGTFIRAPARALLAAGLALGLCASHATAQQAKSAPVATTTLDV